MSIDNLYIPDHICFNREEYMMRPNHYCDRELPICFLDRNYDRITCDQCNKCHNKDNDSNNSNERDDEYHFPPFFQNKQIRNVHLHHHHDECIERLKRRRDMRSIRIKFVGFIYNTINYIADLDNKEIIYKALEEKHYKRLASKVAVNVSPMSKAYSLQFNIKNEHKIAEVEVFPKCVEHSSVTILDLDTHQKEVLDESVVTFEYFDVANMLDKELNLITNVDYNDLFDLTEEDLKSYFNYDESIKLITSFLNNIHTRKDSNDVVRNLLRDIKIQVASKVNIEDKTDEVIEQPTEEELVPIPGVDENPTENNTNEEDKGENNE